MLQTRQTFVSRSFDWKVCDTFSQTEWTTKRIVVAAIGSDYSSNPLIIMRSNVLLFVFTELLAICVLFSHALPAPKANSWGMNPRETKDSNKDKKVDKGNFFKKRQEREQLYEAYNLLHSLAQVSELQTITISIATSSHPNIRHTSMEKQTRLFYPQDFHKPFDAPAVIVVGHQTSGKSALIEALMGFQFNQVGTPAPHARLAPLHAHTHLNSPKFATCFPNRTKQQPTLTTHHHPFSLPISSLSHLFPTIVLSSLLPFLVLIGYHRSAAAPRPDGLSPSACSTTPAAPPPCAS